MKDILERRHGLETDLEKFVDKVFKSESNTEYKDMLINQDNILRDLHLFIEKTAPDNYAIENFKKYITDEFMPKWVAQASSSTYEMLLICCHVILLKENQVGQSVYTQYVEETKAPIDQSGPLPDFEFDNISYKNEALQNIFIEHYSLDGELPYERTQFFMLFYATDLISQTWQKFEEENKQKINHSLLWRARFSMMYNEILSS